jgi:sigma-B regulation protein RsbU (phosphoserine phosphatase)
MAIIACMCVSPAFASDTRKVHVIPRSDYPASAVTLRNGWECLFVPTRDEEPSAIQSTPVSPPDEASAWRSIRQLNVSEATQPGNYWVRIPLPDSLPDPGGLYVSGWSPAFVCFLSDSIIAAYRSPGPEPPDIYRAPEWYVIQLPSGAGGHMLYLWRPFRESLLDLEHSVVAPLPEPSGWKWIVSLEDFILRSIQRGDLGYLALGMVFLIIGVIAFIVFVTRRETRDASLFFFGAMSLFFGVRYLTGTYTFRFWAAGTDVFWDKTVITAGYLSGISAFWFFRCFLGPGWRSSIAWAAIAYSAIACVSVPLIIIYTNPIFIPEITNVMVIACILVIIANISRSRMRNVIAIRGLITALIVSGIFIALENLHGLGLMRLPFNFEWLGVVIIYVTLGLLTGHRFFTKEQHLAAIQRELETARSIQASILPHETPVVPRLRIASRYVPMAELAGDFFDFFAIDENRLGVLVADVSGHGISAALIASMIKVAFHAQREHAAEPERVLSGMNLSLSEQLGEQFVTAGYAFIDTDAGELRYAAAAHPPLLICPGTGGDIVTTDENGLMIGPFPDATYTETARPLASGDRIVMYTDGIIEAVNPDEKEYGEMRLREFMLKNRGLSTEEFSDKLLGDVAAWSESSRNESAADDLTVVVIDFEGTAPSLQSED